MFDHVKFGVSDYAASKAFFLKALEPLGVAVVSAWSVPGVPRELLCSFRHWSGRAQHRSGLPRTPGLILPSSGRAKLRICPPLVSSVGQTTHIT